MKLHRACLREIWMMLLAPFETSFDSVPDGRIFLIVGKVDGAISCGKCTAGERPCYSPETVDTAWHTIRDFAYPLLKGRELSSAGEVWDLLGRTIKMNAAPEGD